MRFGVFYEHQLPRPWADGQRAAALPGRARPGRAGRSARHRLRLGGRAPLPGGVLALLGARGLPGRRVAAHPADPARARHRADAAGLQPSGPRRRAHRHARPRLQRARGLGHRRVGLARGAGGLRHRRRPSAARCGGRPPSRSPTCWRWIPTPASRASTSRCRCRNVVPKPVQKPHPPLWVACSNRETIHLAAQLGIGALTFAFIDPAEARHWVEDYYETFKRECVPIGHAVNPNIAMVTGFSCHADAQEARRRGIDGFRFFQFALGPPLRLRQAQPGRTDIWEKFERVRAELDLDVLGGGTGCIGTPDELRASLRALRGVRRRPDHLHPAGRQEPARAHLRVARAVRGRGDARVQGARGRARRPQGGGARALRGGRLRAQADDGAASPTPTSRPTRPTGSP